MNILDVISLLEPVHYDGFGYGYSFPSIIKFFDGNQYLAEAKLQELEAIGKVKIYYFNEIPVAFKVL